MKQIPIEDAMVEGAVSLEKGDGTVKPWRLPLEDLSLHHETLRQRAECPAGVRLRLRCASRELALGLEPAETPRRFDLTIDNELIVTTEAPAGADRVAFTGLPEGVRTVEIWLPQAQPVRLRHLETEGDDQAGIVPDTRRRWVVYGSSLTHCGGAHSPARTWPATAARALNLKLTCLGYGGACHMEPLVALMIRDLPADYITLKVGINIMGGQSLSPRTFAPALIGMVRIIREAQPTTPISVISPILSPPREAQPNTVGLNLETMRELLSEAVDRLRATEDLHIDYFSGLTLFDESLAPEHLPDDVHPDAEGYEAMGHRFVERIWPAWTGEGLA